MAFREVLILCFSIISATSASHFTGGVMTFRPRETNPDGTLRVDIRFKSGFDSRNPSELSWYCSSGYCGSVVSSSSGVVDISTISAPWSQKETYRVVHLTSDKPFFLSDISCCWISNTLNHDGWSLITAVDLGTRSDTSKPNHSPATTILPIIRVPQNCPTSFKFLTHDPDGDIVRCRYGERYTDECATCYRHPYIDINEENCILSTTTSVTPGTYVFEMVMQDYPRSDIVLRYNDGTVSYRYRPYVRSKRDAKDPRWWHTSAYDTLAFTADTVIDSISETETDSTRRTTTTAQSTYRPRTDTTLKTTAARTQKTTWEHVIYNTSPFIPSDSLSKIPLQFMVQVMGSLSSCEYGVYRPLLLHPTPDHGEILNAIARTPYPIHLLAEASHSSIVDFKVSGPFNMTKGTLTTSGSKASMIVEWTPTDNDVGDHVPFCFAAESNSGYYSEVRCVIVIVGPSHFVNTALQCNENTMTLFIEKSPESGLYENHLRLNDPRCLLSSNSTHHIASVGYNSCGTQIEETEDSIVFKNQVTSFDNITAVITRKHQVIIPFNCSFAKENRLSVLFQPQKAVFEFTEAGFGSFTYKFQFYTDDRFINVQTETPLEVWLRDMLYLEIEVTSSVPNVQLFVESCRATPHDNPNDPVFYNIIDNGCLMDETLVTYPGSWTRSRFGLEAFAFIGNYQDVYLSCTVMLCKLGDPDTRCSQGCSTNSSTVATANRRKRSLNSESLQHYISQGPLRMKRQPSSEESDGKTALNANTLVMSLSGVAIVAIVCSSVYFSMKKARMTKYKRLSTEEL